MRKLQGFDFQIQYKKGLINVVVISLSHLPEVKEIYSGTRMESVTISVFSAPPCALIVILNCSTNGNYIHLQFTLSGQLLPILVTPLLGSYSRPTFLLALPVCSSDCVPHITPFFLQQSKHQQQPPSFSSFL